MIAKTSDETIHSLLNEMRPLLLIAGVPESQIRVRAGKHQMPMLAKAFDWLHDFKMSSEYEELKYVRKLLPEETWKRYDLFEIVGLVEQELLEVVVKKVRKKWRSKRPTIFNKDRKRVKKEMENENKN